MKWGLKFCMFYFTTYVRDILGSVLLKLVRKDLYKKREIWLWQINKYNVKSSFSPVYQLFQYVFYESLQTVVYYIYLCTLVSDETKLKMKKIHLTK